jgi:hypothetical protein
MTTLNRVPEPAPQGAPMPPPLTLPSEIAGPGTDADAPRTATPEILPELVESPAWPRVFPGL